MECSEIIYEIVRNEDKFIPLLIASAIVLGIGIRNVARIFTGVSRERTKREIAAYIAEGSMSPEQGERLLRAGERRCG